MSTKKLGKLLIFPTYFPNYSIVGDLGMAKKNEIVKPGWAISREVKDDFKSFCTKSGLKVQEEFAGSLFLWQKMPEKLRDLAKLAIKSESLVNPHFWVDLAGLIDSTVQGIFGNGKDGRLGKIEESH